MDGAYLHELLHHRSVHQKPERLSNLEETPWGPTESSSTVGLDLSSDGEDERDAVRTETLVVRGGFDRSSDGADDRSRENMPWGESSSPSPFGDGENERKERNEKKENKIREEALKATRVSKPIFINGSENPKIRIDNLLLYFVSI